MGGSPIHPAEILRIDLTLLAEASWELNAASRVIKAKRQSRDWIPDPKDYDAAVAPACPNGNADRDWPVMLWCANRALRRWCICIDACLTDLRSVPAQLVDDPALPRLQQWRSQLRLCLHDAGRSLGCVAGGAPESGVSCSYNLDDFQRHGVPEAWSEIIKGICQFADDLAAVAVDVEGQDPEQPQARTLDSLSIEKTETPCRTPQKQGRKSRKRLPSTTAKRDVQWAEEFAASGMSIKDFAASKSEERSAMSKAIKRGNAARESLS